MVADVARFLHNDRGHYENCKCPVDKNLKIKKKMFCLKTKQNTEMSDEEHSDSEFYHPEEQQTTERNASRHGRHFDKVEASGDTRYEN